MGSGIKGAGSGIRAPGSGIRKQKLGSKQFFKKIGTQLLMVIVTSEDVNGASKFQLNWTPGVRAVAQRANYAPCTDVTIASYLPNEI